MKLRDIKPQKKKGQLGLESIFFIMAFLFAAAIVIVVVYYAWGQIETPFEEAISSAISDGNSTYDVSAMSNSISGGTLTFNVMFPFLVLGLLIFGIVGAFMTQNTPMFFFISLIIIIVAIILGVVFSNVYQQLTETGPLQDTGNTFKVTQLFLKNFPGIVLVMFAVILVVLFAKSKGGGGGGL